MEWVNMEDNEAQNDVYFYTLPPKLQKHITDLISKNILIEDCFGVYYYLALNFEVMKYMDFLRQCIKYYIDNFDEDFLKDDIDIN